MLGVSTAACLLTRDGVGSLHAQSHTAPTSSQDAMSTHPHIDTVRTRPTLSLPASMLMPSPTLCPPTSTLVSCPPAAPPWHLHTTLANLHTDVVSASPYTTPISPLRSCGKMWEAGNPHLSAFISQLLYRNLRDWHFVVMKVNDVWRHLQQLQCHI